MNMHSISKRAIATGLIAIAAAAAVAGGSGSKVVTQADLQWRDMGVPGVVSATVSGDMSKGPSRFFLKYPAGFVTPNHHHSRDHYVTLISGAITLRVDGVEHKLGPGAYFSLTGQPHVATVDGNSEALFFIQADGPWDVVAEK